jgi:hypothetical protein
LIKLYSVIFYREIKEVNNNQGFYIYNIEKLIQLVAMTQIGYNPNNNFNNLLFLFGLDHSIGKDFEDIGTTSVIFKNFKFKTV